MVRARRRAHAVVPISRAVKAKWTRLIPRHAPVTALSVMSASPDEVVAHWRSEPRRHLEVRTQQRHEQLRESSCRSLLELMIGRNS